MTKKYCTLLENLRKKDPMERYTCSITGERCVAVSIDCTVMWEPMHIGGPEVKYDNDVAKLQCPAYNVSSELSDKLRDFKNNVT